MCNSHEQESAAAAALAFGDTLLGGTRRDAQLRVRSVVYVSFFISVLGASMTFPVIPYYAKELGATKAEVGYCFAAWSLASMVGTPIFGVLNDRIGRRPVLLIALLGESLAALRAGTATGLPAFFVSRLIAGACSAGTHSFQVCLTDVCPPDKVPAALARLSAVPGAAMMIGPVLGGWLAVLGHNVPFMVDAGTQLCAFFLVLLFLPEPKPAAAKEQKPSAVPFRANILGGAAFLTGIYVGTSVSMLAVTLDQRYGFGPTAVGYVTSARAMMMLLMTTLVVPTIQKRIGVLYTAITGTVWSAFFLFLFAISVNLYFAFGALCLNVAGSTLRMASAGALSARVSDDTNRGQVFARVLFFGGLGGLCGPVVAGQLAEHYGLEATWICASGCSMLSAVVLYFSETRRRVDPDVEMAQSNAASAA